MNRILLFLRVSSACCLVVSCSGSMLTTNLNLGHFGASDKRDSRFLAATKTNVISEWLILSYHVRFASIISFLHVHVFYSAFSINRQNREQKD